MLQLVIFQSQKTGAVCACQLYFIKTVKNFRNKFTYIKNSEKLKEKNLSCMLIIETKTLASSDVQFAC